MKKILTIILLSISVCQFSFAFTWHDLWRRPDQQAAQALAKGKPGEAADLFQNPHWRAVAQYKSGHYQQAVDSLQKFDTDQDNYNRGNALAHIGQYQAAIKAYDAALKINAQNKDAKFNKALLEKLLKQQQAQHKKSSQAKSSQQSTDQQQQPNDKQHAKQNSKQQQHNSQQNKQQQADNKNQSKQQQGQSKQQSSKQQAKQQHQPQGKAQAKQKPLSKAQRDQMQAQARQKAATKRWLNQIPDNPGGLLQQKFLRDYQRSLERG